MDQGQWHLPTGSRSTLVTTSWTSNWKPTSAVISSARDLNSLALSDRGIHLPLVRVENRPSIVPAINLFLRSQTGSDQAGPYLWDPSRPYQWESHSETPSPFLWIPYLILLQSYFLGCFQSNLHPKIATIPLSFSVSLKNFNVWSFFFQNFV